MRHTISVNPVGLNITGVSFVVVLPRSPAWLSSP